MQPLWHADPRFSAPNILDTDAFKQASKSLLNVDRDRGAFFKAQWADHYYSKLYVPTESTTTPVVRSELVTQAENSWFTACEDANLDAQESQERPVFTFASAGSDANASVPPSKIQSVEDADEGEKKKSQRLHESRQLLRCRRIKISPTPAQARFLHQVLGIHRYIYNECVDMEDNREINGMGMAEKNRVRKLLTGKVAPNGQNEWKNIVPCHTKQQAVDEFFRAKKAALLNVSAGNASQFKMKRRQRFKSRQESLPLEKYKFVDYRDYCTRSKGTGEASIVIKSGINQRTRERFNLQDIPSELSLRINGPVPREFRRWKDSSFVREEIKIVRTRLGEYFAIISWTSSPSRHLLSQACSSACSTTHHRRLS